VFPLKGKGGKLKGEGQRGEEGKRELRETVGLVQTRPQVSTPRSGPCEEPQKKKSGLSWQRREKRQ